MQALLHWYQHLPQGLLPYIKIGSLEIPFLRYYSLGYVLALFTVYFLSRYRLKHDNLKIKSLDVKKLEELLFTLAIGLILGARFGYMIFYAPGQFFSNPFLTFWPFRNGQFTGLSGMSYHGGVLGIVIAFWYLSKKYQMGLRDLADFFLVSVPLAYTWGRLGNFMNGELYGRVTDSWVGMYFNDGSSTPTLRHPSQLYEAFSEGILLWLILWPLRNKNLPTGVISGLYLIGYGMARFVVEFFRQPDKQFQDPGETLGFVFYQFTMGQLLCFSMIVAGSLLIYFGYRDQRNGV